MIFRLKCWFMHCHLLNGRCHTRLHSLSLIIIKTVWWQNVIKFNYIFKLKQNDIFAQQTVGFVCRYAVLPFEMHLLIHWSPFDWVYLVINWMLRFLSGDEDWERIGIFLLSHSWCVENWWHTQLRLHEGRMCLSKINHPNCMPSQVDVLDFDLGGDDDISKVHRTWSAECVIAFVMNWMGLFFFVFVFFLGLVRYESIERKGPRPKSCLFYRFRVSRIQFTSTYFGQTHQAQHLPFAFSSSFARSGKQRSLGIYCRDCYMNNWMAFERLRI